MPRKKLEEYLYYVMLEEQRKYELEKIGKCAYRKKKEWENRVYQYVEKPEEIKPFRKRRKISDILIGMIFMGLGGWLCGGLLFLGIGLLLWIISFIFGFINTHLAELFNNIFLWIESTIHVEFFPLIGAVIGVLSAIVANPDGITKKEAKQANDEAKRKYDRETEQTKSYNNDLKRNKSYYIPLYQDECEILTQNYRQVKQNLENLYNLNIIYPKYRNIAAVCSLYEYISSGKCDSLGGYMGAYVMYDMEVKQNMIIEKLDVIINQLECIKQNQYMLYSRMYEANLNISNMSEQLNCISNNSYITAYNSKIAAENTEFMKWFNIFTEIKRDKQYEQMYNN